MGYYRSPCFGKKVMIKPVAAKDLMLIAEILVNAIQFFIPDVLQVGEQFMVLPTTQIKYRLLQHTILQVQQGELEAP